MIRSATGESRTPPQDLSGVAEAIEGSDLEARVRNRAPSRQLGPGARGVGRRAAGKPVEAELLYLSSVSRCEPGRLPDERSRHRASAAGSTSRALWRARRGVVIPVGVDERRHVVDDQESRDQPLAEVQDGGVLAMGDGDATLLDLDGLLPQNDDTLAVAAVLQGFS